MPIIIHFRKISKNIEQDHIKQTKNLPKGEKATKEGKGTTSNG